MRGTASLPRCALQTSTPFGGMRAPSGLAVGAYVYAKDKKGYWYRAKVLAERGGNPRSFFVHFQGFRSNHDEWVPKARIRLNATKAQIVQLNAESADFTFAFLESGWLGVPISRYVLESGWLGPESSISMARCTTVDVCATS